MFLTISNQSLTLITVTFNERNGATSSIDLQHSVRPDFKLAIAPITRLANAATQNIYGLWSNTTYYIRAREIIAGVPGEWTQVVAARTTDGNPQDFSPQAQTHEKAMIVVPSPVVAWTADAALAGYPVDNLGYDAPVGWRGPAFPAGNLYAFTMQVAPEPVDVIALLFGNPAQNATVTIKAGNTAAQAKDAPLFTHVHGNYAQSSRLSARLGYHCLIELPSLQSYSFWRVEITSSMFGSFELHHAVIGRNRATKMHAIDLTSTPIDLGSMGRSRSGAPQRAIGWRMRREEFDIAALSEGDFEKNYRDLGWRVGNTEPVLVVPNPKRVSYLQDRILYGTLGNSSRHTNLRGPLYTRSFSIDSLI